MIRKHLKKGNPDSTFPREFVTGRWHVHLVFPGEPRADGIPCGSKKGNPPAPTRWSSSTILGAGGS